MSSKEPLKTTTLIGWMWKHGDEGAAIGDLLRGGQQQPQQNTTNDNPIMGIGSQILKGQGIKLPGLFGGQNNSTPPDGK